MASSQNKFIKLVVDNGTAVPSISPSYSTDASSIPPKNSQKRILGRRAETGQFEAARREPPFNFPQINWKSANVNSPGTAPGANKPFLRSSAPSSNDRTDNVMSEQPTREEVNAKLEAVEARLETRLVSLDGKMDVLLGEIRHVGDTAREAKKDASNIKWNVLFTALGTIGVISAVILAMWAVGYQVADIVRQVSVPIVKTDTQLPSNLTTVPPVVTTIPPPVVEPPKE